MCRLPSPMWPNQTTSNCGYSRPSSAWISARNAGIAETRTDTSFLYGT